VYLSNKKFLTTSSVSSITFSSASGVTCPLWGDNCLISAGLFPASPEPPFQEAIIVAEISNMHLITSETPTLKEWDLEDATLSNFYFKTKQNQ
jgi:hypothetical protein